MSDKSFVDRLVVFSCHQQFFWCTYMCVNWKVTLWSKSSWKEAVKRALRRLHLIVGFLKCWKILRVEFDKFTGLESSGYPGNPRIFSLSRNWPSRQENFFQMFVVFYWHWSNNLAPPSCHRIITISWDNKYAVFFIDSLISLKSTNDKTHTIQYNVGIYCPLYTKPDLEALQ